MRIISFFTFIGISLLLYSTAYTESLRIPCNGEVRPINLGQLITHSDLILVGEILNQVGEANLPINNLNSRYHSSTYNFEINEIIKNYDEPSRRLFVGSQISLFVNGSKNLTWKKETSESTFASGTGIVDGRSPNLEPQQKYLVFIKSVQRPHVSGYKVMYPGVDGNLVHGDAVLPADVANTYFFPHQFFGAFLIAGDKLAAPSYLPTNLSSDLQCNPNWKFSDGKTLIGQSKSIGENSIRESLDNIQALEQSFKNRGRELLKTDKSGVAPDVQD